MKVRTFTGRRRFLLAAGLGSAGAVVAVATARKAGAPAAQKQKQASAAETAQGYRVTEHIEKYYKTTEI